MDTKTNVVKVRRQLTSLAWIRGRGRLTVPPVKVTSAQLMPPPFLAPTHILQSRGLTCAARNRGRRPWLHRDAKGCCAALGKLPLGFRTPYLVVVVVVVGTPCYVVHSTEYYLLLPVGKYAHATCPACVHIPFPSYHVCTTTVTVGSGVHQRERWPSHSRARNASRQGQPVTAGKALAVLHTSTLLTSYH